MKKKKVGVFKVQSEHFLFYSNVERCLPDPTEQILEQVRKGWEEMKMKTPEIGMIYESWLINTIPTSVSQSQL